jgi:DNA-binding transcriptional LysR family regulator
MVSSAKYFLPRMLAQFHGERRDVELQLSVGNRHHLIERLRRGEVELAVMGSPPGEMEGLAEAFAEQPLGIIAPADHALNGQAAIPVEALSEQEFIVRESGSGTRAAMERFFHDAHIEPPRVMEMSSNEAIKQAVIASMGLAFLSLHSAMPELQGDLLVALDVVGLPLSRRWFIVQTDAKPLSQAAAALRDFILAHGGESIARQLCGLTGASLAPAVTSLARKVGMLPA